jgi:hypothetical protein
MYYNAIGYFSTKLFIAQTEIWVEHSLYSKSCNAWVDLILDVKSMIINISAVRIAQLV